jgi:hypothetical protein
VKKYLIITEPPTTTTTITAMKQETNDVEEMQLFQGKTQTAINQ